MNDSEPIRARILARLAELIGPEEAAAIMESIPPFDWSQLATKADLEALATKADLEALATRADLEAVATRAALAELRADVTDLRTGLTDLRSDVTDLRTGLTDLRSDVADLRTGLVAVERVMATRDDLSEAIARSEATMTARIEAGELRTITAIHDLRAELHATVHAAFMRVMTLLVPTILSGVGIAFVAARYA